MRFLLLICLPLTCLSQTPDRLAGKGQIHKNSYTADTAQVNHLNQLAQEYCDRLSDTALVFTKQSTTLANNTGYTAGVADALMVESKLYRRKGDFAVALNKALAAIKLYEKIPATSQVGFSMVEVAQIYKDMTGQGQTKEYSNTGIAYGKNAYQLFQSVGDTAGMVFSLNMQGIIYRDKGKTNESFFYDSALAAFQKAFALIEKSKGKGEKYIGKLYNNISQVYLEHKKDQKTALEYLMKAVAFNKSHNNLSSLSYNYGNISYAYTKLNDHYNAIKYGRLMRDITLQEGTPVRIQNSYQQLYTAFLASGHPDSALFYYVLSDQINDSLTNVKKTQQVMDLQVQYETAKKEAEIAKLNKQGADQKQKILLLILVASIIACLAFAMVWLYQRVSAQKKQLALQSHKLEVLMKELHHRVKNNLQIVSSLLSLQTYKLHDDETISVLRESQQRVQAMSLIHQRLYTRDTLSQVNMKEYITDLVESLVSSYGFDKNEIDLSINIDKALLDVEKALPIGLLINEMVTNSLKYAFDAGTGNALTIDLAENKDGLELTVKDNGKGIDLAKWHAKGGSFGKQLINVLSKQLRAKQEVQVSNGTQFSIFIPVKAA